MQISSESLEKIIDETCDGLFMSLYPRLTDRRKTIHYIEGTHIALVEKSPRLRNNRKRNKWLIKMLAEQSGIHNLAKSFTDGLSSDEKELLQTNLRIYRNHEGDHSAKRKSNLKALLVFIAVAIVLGIGVTIGIINFIKHGNEVSKAVYGKNSQTNVCVLNTEEIYEY